MAILRRLITADSKVIFLNDDGTWTDEVATVTALEKWKSLTLTQDILGLFKGLFEILGVRIIETGEELTCTLRDDGMEFTAGVNEDAVDFSVDIHAFQVELLAEYVAKGHLTDLERFLIARELFLRSTTGKRSVLFNPLISNRILRKLIRGQRLCHFHLLSPDPEQEDDARFTLIYVDPRWMVLEGLHGQPGRILRVSVTDALDLQAHLFAGMKMGGLMAWLRISKWYINWRKKVEVPA